MDSMHTRQVTARWRMVMGKDKVMEGGVNVRYLDVDSTIVGSHIFRRLGSTSGSQSPEALGSHE